MDISKLILTSILFVVGLSLFSQNMTIPQTLRGTVIDADTKMPMVGVTVTVSKDGEYPFGTITNNIGEFTINELTIGRYNVAFSFIGYTSIQMYDVLLISGKETVLNINLKEIAFELGDVTVSAASQVNKEEALNTMSIISSKMFTVDEAHKFAGGFDDPGRLVTAFAGVAGGSNPGSNGVIVRGNAPMNILWTLEGVEIPSPNHFNGGDVEGGGVVSAFSAHMLDNSDFFTGAFPAEFGNATSGVFDMRLRRGDNQQHESGAQVSTMGVDLFSEGPFKKGKQSSYLFNYRYSTLKLISDMGVLPEGMNIPAYQDLSFKLNFPTKNTGTFSLWGVGMLDDLQSASIDTTEWHVNEKFRVQSHMAMNTGIIGATHAITLSEKSFLKTSLVANTVSSKKYINLFEKDGFTQDWTDERYTTWRTTLRSHLNYKFTKRHANRTGFDISYMGNDYILTADTVDVGNMVNVGDYKGYAILSKFFSQSRINITKRLEANIGVHVMHFSLNGEFVPEVRGGLRYNYGKSIFSIGYGGHSRLNPLPVYFAAFPDPSGNKLPNKDLKMTKAHHIGMSYDRSIGKYSHLKTELFYQHLYQVPIIPDSTYSLINYMTEYAGIQNKMTNDGLGKNYGLELTYERFLNKGFYALGTATLYKSEYKAGNGNWYNTQYNYRYIINLLAGYEFSLKNKNNVWGVNLRLTTLGGEPHDKIIPDVQEYVTLITPLTDASQPFTERFKSGYFCDATFSYTVNKPKASWEMGLMLKNMIGSEVPFVMYDYETQSAKEDGFNYTYPNLFFKVNF